VDNTTEHDGGIDAVAASLIDGPVEQDEIEDTQAEDAADYDDDQGDGAADDVGDDVADDDTQDDDADQADDEGEDDGDDEASSDADEGDKTEQLFTVKVDGRTLQVPLNELLRGYSGQAYIQKGMHEVATLAQTLNSERAQVLQMMQSLQSGQVPLQPPAPPDDTLLASDPIGYLEDRVKYEKALTEFQRGQTMQQELSRQQQQEAEKAHLAMLAEQHQQLARVIPAFAKPETAKQAKQQLLEAGTKFYGFAPEELAGVADHRMILALHDAAQYRRLMAGRTTAEQRATRPQTPTLKAGVKSSVNSGKRAQSERIKSRMTTTGSVDDVARYLLT
jgi:hypothetical protein